MLFIELPFTLATEEAERIGVDHVAKISSTGVVEGSGMIIVSVIGKEEKISRD